MEECIVVSDVVGRVFGYLDRSDRKVMAPYFGGRNKLKQAEDVLLAINSFILDVERQVQVDEEQPSYVIEFMKRMNRILYEMEDLLEDVIMAKKDDERIPGGKLTKPLCILASSPGLFIIKWRTARHLRKCMRDLLDITDERVNFGPKNCPTKQDQLVNKSDWRETCSYVLANEVIGREEDSKAIVNMLDSSISDPYGEYAVSAIAIVGMGGLGKTALAQLVYYDKFVRDNFDLIAWVSVSEIFDLSQIARKILLSITGDDSHQLSYRQLQARLGEALNNRKFLLVLDDVWNEDRGSWLQLWNSIRDGIKGSKILVTTRSSRVAQVMGLRSDLVYNLKALSPGHSWELFTRLAFRNGQEIYPRLTTIGRQIVARCAGVPLAIRVISGLLYCRETEEWERLLHTFNDTKTLHGHIFQVLKLSYTHLPGHLKKCFAYCSLFPRDYEFKRLDVIYLWMAQGFIRPLHGSNLTLEEVGDNHFMDLLARSFFQNVKQNESSGEIISFKMNDLIHDLALHVGQDECHSAVEHQRIPNNENILHVSFVIDSSSWEAPSWLHNAKQFRSLLLFPGEFDGHITILNIDKVLSSLRRLRVLVLEKTECKHLPDSIGQMKHLRYLKLGGPVESLPGSITRLHYLQTLDLQACGQYVKFPKGFTNFSKVKLLCSWPHYKFVVDESKGLKELVSSLDKPVRKLEINFKNRRAKALSEAQDANLKSIYVNDLVLEWSSSYGEPDTEAAEDKLLQCLQPSQYVHSLAVHFWKGVNFPSWGMNDSPRVNILNLVSIEIEGCCRCQHLPSFSRLPDLRCLQLLNLKSLEYVEIRANHYGASSESYFKSLENLKLEELPKLKGWSRVEGHVDGQELESHQQLSFPYLSEITVYLCPKLMSMPQAPKLETLSLEEIHPELVRHLMLPSSSTLNAFKELEIASVHQLESLSIDQSLHRSLRIKTCEQLVNLTAPCPIFPRQLEVHNCGRLRDMSGALQQVEQLKIWRCEELNLWGMINEDNTGVDHVASSSGSVRSVDWQDLKGLRFLTIGCIRKLESLPRGLDWLTALQELKIFQLCNLRALPKWIGRLTQLRRLEIVECPNMRTLFIVSADEPDSFTINLPSLAIRIERCRELLALFAGTAVCFQRLEVHRCAKLKGISSAELEIKELVVNYCEKLHLWEDDEEISVDTDVRTAAVEAWQGLKSLNSLTLERILKLKSPPKGFCCLPVLQELKMFQLHMEALPLQIDYLTQLSLIEIVDCSRLRTMSISPGPAPVGEVDYAMGVNHNQLSTLRIERCPEFINMIVESPTTLQYFEIRKCGKMKEISWEELLVAKLVIEDCDELDLWNDQADSSSSEIVRPAAWRALTLFNISKLESLPTRLQSATVLEELELIKLRNLKTLPEWIGQLTQLDRLDILQCPEFAALPESLPQLTRLQRLRIHGCNPELKIRCRKPNGQDWPKIQNILEARVT